MQVHASTGPLSRPVLACAYATPAGLEQFRDVVVSLLLFSRSLDKRATREKAREAMADQSVYAVEQLDKGAWEVVNRSTNESVHVFATRARARAALDALNKGASEQEVRDGVADKSKMTNIKRDMKKNLAKEKTSNLSVRRIHGSEQPTAFALKKRAKNFDAMIDRYGKLPQGLIDVFNPRNVEGFVGLYHTISVVEFDVSQIATTYVLRVEETGELFECSDKRDGRLRASQLTAKPPKKSTYKKKQVVSTTDSDSSTESVNNPPF